MNTGDADTFAFDDDADAIGRADPWQERDAGLPSDLACAVCGDAIESGARCMQLRYGRNRLGEFRNDDTASAVVCLDCVGGRS